MSISIYNHLGQVVKTLVSGQDQEAGRHTVIWDGKDERGAEVSNGVYFLEFEAGEYVTVRKLVKLN